MSHILTFGYVIEDDIMRGTGFSDAAQLAFVGDVDMADAMAERLGITKRDLASMAGLAAATLQRKDRANAPATLARLNEVTDIITRVTAWAGGERQAFAWYRAQPLAAFGDRTAESLVKAGDAGAVRDYLDHLALGGFA